MKLIDVLILDCLGLPLCKTYLLGSRVCREIRGAGFHRVGKGMERLHILVGRWGLGSKFKKTNEDSPLYLTPTLPKLTITQTTVYSYYDDDNRVLPRIY